MKKVETKYNDVSGKLPPQAVELEEAVLGALIIEPDGFSEIADLLHPMDFYKEGHQFIYSVLLNLFRNSQPIDLLIVVQELRKSEKLEVIGGSQYLARLTTKVNSSANIEHHAYIIKEASMKRKSIELGYKILAESYKDSTDFFEFRELIEREFLELSNQVERQKHTNLLLQLNDTFQSIASTSNQIYDGIQSKYEQLNNLITCYENSNLYLIAARPSMGKSAFMINEVISMVEKKEYVMVFSLEMSAKQQLQRILALKAMVNYSNIRSGRLTTDEWKELDIARNKISNYHPYLKIDDDSDLTIAKLASKARKAKMKKELNAIFIDYLGLMNFGVEVKGKSTSDQIGSISRGLKNLAKELEVPIIALSQLSRAVEQRGGEKRPQLSDLRDSGSLEQDADSVFFLYRPEYYKITQYSDGSPTNGICEIIVAKNRAGKVAVMDNEIPKLAFLGQYQKMTDLESVQLNVFNKINNKQKSFELEGDFPF